MSAKNKTFSKEQHTCGSNSYKCIRKRHWTLDPGFLCFPLTVRWQSRNRKITSRIKSCALLLVTLGILGFHILLTILVEVYMEVLYQNRWKKCVKLQHFKILYWLSLKWPTTSLKVQCRFTLKFIVLWSERYQCCWNNCKTTFVLLVCDYIEKKKS